MLRQCEKYAEQSGNQADHHQQSAPPDWRRSEQRKHAEDAINSHFDHHARHQCRNMARRRGMRLRQPDVQGNKAGLGAKTDDAQNEQDAARFTISKGDLCKGSKVHRAARLGRKQPKHHEQEYHADVGGDQVGVTCLLRLGFCILKSDQKKGGKGHNLPGDDEQHAVCRSHNQGHAENEQIEE